MVFFACTIVTQSLAEMASRGRGALFRAFLKVVSVAVVSVAYTRYRVRHHRGILHGDVLTDMCIAVLFYPLALVQHEKELRAPDDFYDGSLDKESEEKEA